MSNLTKSDFVALDEAVANQVDIATEKLDRRKEDQGWHLKKEISMSLIISVLGIAGAGMVAYGDLKRDIAVMQADLATLHAADNDARETLRESVQRFNVAIDKIDSKLDRMMGTK